MARRVGPASGEPRVRGLTIGEAAARLAAEFPGLRPETLCAMERRGLLEPRRTASGYRRYTEHDLDTVRRVLAPAEPAASGAPRTPPPPAPPGPTASRTTSRPAPSAPAASGTPPEPADSGASPTPPPPASAPPRPRAEPPTAPVPAAAAPYQAPSRDNSGASGKIRSSAALDAPAAAPTPAAATPAARRRSPRWPEPEYFTPELGEVTLDAPGLARAAGLDEHRVAELAGYGLISGAQPATGADLLVARAAADLLDHGIEPRHLRPVALAAGRAAALIRAAGGGAARVPAAPAAAALVRLEAALLRAALLDD